MSLPDQDRVYSTPRRFDLATVLVITSAYALGFSALRVLQMPLVELAVIGGFVTTVGLSQAVLFGGRHPRIASMVTGAVLLPTLVILFDSRPGSRSLVDDIVLLVTYCSFFGAIHGYFAGAMVGGVFLVSDKVRSRFFRHT
ncbi:MAG: hypothetical protein KDA92_03830 [Planctomycetales bacterium]|nr:hypothetical protein [Planctomycetales bacterium]